MSDLTEHLLAAGPDLDEPEARERFRIDSDDLAKWALRKLAAAQAEQARIRGDAQAEIDRIQAYAQRAAAEADHDVAFFTARLIEYRRDLEAQNPKLPKTYRVATGALIHHAGRPSVKVTEKDNFVSWALDNAPDALRYEPLVSVMKDWTRKDDDGVTRIVSPDGEVVPGVEVQRGDDKYDALPASDLDGAF